MQADPPLRFFSAWFCPYAQRAWIALEHTGVPFERIEALKLNEDRNSYWKDERLIAVNPKGLVPTLTLSPRAVAVAGGEGKSGDGEGGEEGGAVGVSGASSKIPMVTDSLVCVEFIEDMAAEAAFAAAKRGGDTEGDTEGDRGGDRGGESLLRVTPATFPPTILSGDPWMRAFERRYVRHVRHRIMRHVTVSNIFTTIRYVTLDNGHPCAPAKHSDIFRPHTETMTHAFAHSGGTLNTNTVTAHFHIR